MAEATQTQPGLTNHERAVRRLRWTFILFVVSAFTAAIWDGLYHLENSFDGFFSPPHVFAYASAGLVALLTADLVFSHRLRPQFGPGFRVPGFPYLIPGSLFVLNGSVVMLGFAGLVLDNIWHTNFGLNETPWSFPHAMIGWSLLLIGLGFLSSRMALGRLTLGWTLILGVMLVGVSVRPVLGPLAANPSLDVVRATALIPSFAGNPDIQSTMQIYLEWNLTRANPAFVALAPLWAGLALAFVRRLDARTWVFLLIALLATWSSDEGRTAEWLSQFLPGLASSEAATSPLPLFAMALGFVLLRAIRIPPAWAWGMAGFIFGLLVLWTFDAPGSAYLLLALAPISAVVGAAIGERAYAIVAAPVSFRVVLPLLAAGVVVPFATGLLDLFLRANTP